jgi:hypothetical protein
MLRKSFFQVLALAGPMLAFTTRGICQTAGPRSVITQALDENRLVTLPGNTRPEANSKNDLGLAGNDLHLDMYLQLKRSPEQDLAAQQFVDSLTDKASPNFHKWITAAEYGQRFGLASEDIAIVSRWLDSHGFTVNDIPANHMVIDFSGNAGQVREALHTEIHNLDVAGERHFANMSDPQIPAALLPAVTGVVSLHNFKPRPMLVPKGQYTVNSYDFPVVPGDLATIYNLNPAFSAGYTGRGQTIVLVEDTDLYNGTGDWSVFRSTFGLNLYPYGSLTEVHPASGAGGACSDPGINGDDSEAAIDVEWASAAAPNAAIVMASCTDTTNFGGFIALQNMLTNGGPVPGIVSISYGTSETENGAAANSYINTLYQTAATAGVSVFVSSGDSAAAASDRGDTAAIYGINVSAYASTQYDVAVGGTDFGDTAAGTTATYWNSTNGTYYNSAKSYVPEIPWNESCASGVLVNYEGFSTAYGASGFCNAYPYYADTIGGSGGPSGCATGARAIDYTVSGTCAGYGKPSWQSILGNPNDGVRDLPDVALFASAGFWDHYYVVCFSAEASCAGLPDTWAGFGGTSVASPIMAGIQALINQALGSTNVGNPNPVYYEIGQNEYSISPGAAACNSTTGPASTCSFNDVTHGDMVVPCAGAVNCYLDGEALGVLSTSDTSYAPAYGATTGWDFATGIGSVNTFNLLNAFVKSIAPGVPTAVSATPSGESGSSETFAFAFSDSTGAANITAAQIGFNTSMAGTNSCWMYYAASTQTIYLANNAGAFASGGLVLGSSGTLQNSQCTINAATSSVVLSGDTLTLNLALSFAPAFAGMKNIYMYVQNAAVASGFTQEGTWTVPVPAGPVPVSVTPSGESGSSQTFAFAFSDSAGASDITAAQIGFNTSMAGTNSCWMYYAAATETIYLANNAGAFAGGGLVLGSSGTLQNSQCTINVATSSVLLSGDTLTLNLALSFTPAFAGTQNIYMYVQNATLSNGFTQEGTWTVPVPAGPVLVSVTPSGESGPSQTFAFAFSDSAGASDITAAQIGFNTSMAGANSCWMYYAASTQTIYLANNAGAFAGGGLVLGSSGTLENSQCTINVAASSVLLSGNTLTLSLVLSFAPAFAGVQNIYMYVQNATLANGFTPEGTWTVP